MSGDKETAAFLPILQRFKVPRDGALVVHSAIATLSRKGYRAKGIIECLIEHMRDGSARFANIFYPVGIAIDQEHTGIRNLSARLRIKRSVV